MSDRELNSKTQLDQVEYDDNQDPSQVPTPPTVAGGAPGITLEFDDTLESGTKIDRYVIVDHLSTGGMGVVYRAHDPQLNRRIALKLLRPRNVESDTDDETRARLLREAQALAKLAHPNVVTVFDVGTAGDDVFVAMELIEGVTLRQWMRARPRSQREVLPVFLAAGAGLAAAHRAGLTHRDFKPDNVLLGDDGRARVLDFGLACANRDQELSVPEFVSVSGDNLMSETGDLRSSTPLTHADDRVGTPQYMAPEQHAGGGVDGRTDQFSYCVALYEALYGHRPFAGKTYRQLAKSVQLGVVRAAPKDARVPGWLREVILRGLSVDADARFPSMDALLEALAKDPEAARRRMLRVVAGAVALIALGGLVVALATRDDQPSSSLCKDSEASLIGVWDDSRRAAIERAFESSERSYAMTTFARVSTVLDEYAADWTAMRTESCQATRVGGHQSERMLDLRTACLERRLAELSAFTSLLAEQLDDSGVDRATESAHGLSDISQCGDISALNSAVALPADTAARVRAAALRADLARAKVLDRAGRYWEGEALAKTTEKEARELGYGPVLAAALYQYAVVSSALGNAADAEILLVDAAEVATEAGDAPLAAQSWARLVYVVGYEQGRYDEAVGLALVATSMASLVGSRTTVRTALLNNEGLAAARAGKHERSLQLYLRSLASLEKAFGPDDLRIAHVLSNIGVTLSGMGRYQKAAERLERATSIRRSGLGQGHPLLAMLHNNLGDAYLGKRDYARAEALFRSAKSVWRKTLGSAHPNVVMASLNLGEVFAERREYDACRQEYAWALETVERVAGPGHVYVAYGLAGLGRCWLDDGHADRAVPLLERSLTIVGSEADDPNEVAKRRFDLARALWIQPGQRARSLSLAKQALAVFQERGKVALDSQSAARAWLAKHSR